jgi:GNAT superfamily N-acetyltransferase
MNFEEYTIEHLTNFEELSGFYTGKVEMDEFIHNHLKDCEETHYCKTFCVRQKTGNAIIAMFALAFDSVDIEMDDFHDMRIGAAGTSVPSVKESYREQFEQKSTYPALEITYLAVDKKYQCLHVGSALIEQIILMARSQKLAGCVFLTTKAWHISNYSAVGFYEKNQFAKLTPIPQMEVWPMYRTIWPDEPE